MANCAIAPSSSITAGDQLSAWEERQGSQASCADVGVAGKHS
jgi:hypothetical protein